MSFLNLLYSFLIFFIICAFSQLDIGKYLISVLALLAAESVLSVLVFASKSRGIYLQLLINESLSLFKFLAAYFIINKVCNFTPRGIIQALVFAFFAQVVLMITQNFRSALIVSNAVLASIAYQAFMLGSIWLVSYNMEKFNKNRNRQAASQPSPSTPQQNAPMPPVPPKSLQAGTQYRDQSHATATWIASHTTKYTPVIICKFEDLSTARNAIEQLSFIKKSGPDGQYVSSEVIEYGCYLNSEGKGEVILCGRQLSADMFSEAKNKFTAAGGTVYREQEPRQDREPAPSTTQESALEPCTYLHVERNGNNTYEVYRGKSKAQALAFLQDKTVTQRLYYIIVETPEGNFGRDIDGIFQE